MMIATERAVAGRAGSSSGRSRRSARSRLTRLMAARSSPSSRAEARSSDLHDLLFLPLEKVVDAVDVLVRDLLEPLLGPAFLVVADLSVPHQLLEVVHDVAPDVPDRDAALLGQVTDDLDELLAPLLREGGYRQANQLAVVRGRDAEVGFEDRALDRLHRARIERLDGEHSRLGHVDRGQLLDGGLLAVVVDVDPVGQRRRGSAGTDRVELVLGRLDGLVHAPLAVVEQVVDHPCLLSLALVASYEAAGRGIERGALRG